MYTHINHLLVALTIPGPNGGTQTITAPNAVNCGGNGVSCTTTVMTYVVQLLFGVAIILAFAFLLWGGIDWIMSRGDKQKLQKARMKLIYSIIGLLIVFFAFFIVTFAGKVLGLQLLGGTGN